ncbi:hypothetical protein HYPBUDRAFT_114191 [Hyphopichia burtonii NRRL Y-1933]|uniref:Endoplasmic reticulum transmembrane protein n=1 Tax=Hyphopichia burtonii NRRL Y-1933 TaxID=984485 RepID=A0A1E4RCY5_9ASCO|nr:hypothetical protein HYPBUDRAFT_114191 [Hyphopichia burtonii NRRL Y-1933]ODV65096.1 hypothetical protein HYPBUDRAFT_114191 [Hyphopichia burtonii NRRL Y-1933]
MSLQMSLVFGALIGQMGILVLLLLPLPLSVRTKIVEIYDLLGNSTNVKVGIVFSVSLLGLSFIDCVQRLGRYGFNSPYFTNFNAVASQGNLTYDQLATKFYTQRNLYLNGAVLYLTLSIYTMITIIKKLVKKEIEYRNLSQINEGEFASNEEEIAKYKELIKQKEIDIKTFKKQVEGLQKSYNDLTPSNETSKTD